MKKTYQAIFSKGTSVDNRKFVLYHLEKNQSHYRVGLSVSKKLGNAVTRNSIKRKIRHVIMELSPNLLNQDFVIIARKGVEELDYHEVKKNLLHVLKLANLYQEGLNSEKKD